MLNPAHSRCYRSGVIEESPRFRKLLRKYSVYSAFQSSAHNVGSVRYPERIFDRSAAFAKSPGKRRYTV